VILKKWERMWNCVDKGNNKRRKEKRNSKRVQKIAGGIQRCVFRKATTRTVTRQRRK
jgi:hypothetical protein